MSNEYKSPKLVSSLAFKGETKPITKQPNQLITRDQRAHRRLSWAQRWSRNSILDTAAHWRVTLFGISSAILDWLGSLKPSPTLII